MKCSFFAMNMVFARDKSEAKVHPYVSNYHQNDLDKNPEYFCDVFIEIPHLNITFSQHTT